MWCFFSLGGGGILYQDIQGDASRFLAPAFGRIPSWERSHIPWKVNYDSMSFQTSRLVGHVLLFPRGFFWGGTFSIHIEVRRVASIQVMCWGPCNHGSVMTCPSTTTMGDLSHGVGARSVWGFFLRPSRSRRSDFHRGCGMGSSAIFFETKNQAKGEM